MEINKKIKLVFEEVSVLLFYDFSFIKFPKIFIDNGCIMVAANERLSEFSNTNNSLLFYKAIFYGELIVTNSTFEINLNFRECTFKDKFSLIKSIVQNIDFSNVIFLNNVLIENTIFQKGTKFTNSTFKELLTLNKVSFKDEVNLQINSLKESSFKRLTFEDTAGFGGAHFNGETSFFNCSFEGFTEFTETTFHKEGRVSFSAINFNKVHFLKTKFLAPVSFYFSQADLFAMKDVVIKKITLNHTFFKDADIIDLYALPASQKADLKLIPLSKENIKDRETARTLKLLFDKRSNIHDSNNLFSIEQEFYTEELTSNSKPPSPHNWNNLSALYLNKIVSNFGTD